MEDADACNVRRCKISDFFLTVKGLGQMELSAPGGDHVDMQGSVPDLDWTLSRGVEAGYPTNGLGLYSWPKKVDIEKPMDQASDVQCRPGELIS